MSANPSFWDTLRARDDEEEDFDSLSDQGDSSVQNSRLGSRSTSPTTKTPDSATLEAAPPNSELLERVKDILSNMSAKGLSLPIFLNAISWGDSIFVADSQIRTARTSLMHSPLLPGILQRWWMPPRSLASNKSRTKAARPVMEEFAHVCVRETLDYELDAVSELLRSQNDATEEFFTQMSFSELGSDIQAVAPLLWSLLRRSAYTERQERRNTTKDPNKVSNDHSVGTHGLDVMLTEATTYRLYSWLLPCSAILVCIMQTKSRSCLPSI